MFGFKRGKKLPKGMETFMDALLKVVGGDERIKDALGEHINNALDDMYHDHVITGEQHHDLQMFVGETLGFDDSFVRNPTKNVEPEQTQEDREKIAEAARIRAKQKAKQEEQINADEKKQDSKPDNHTPTKPMTTTSMTPTKNDQKTLSDCPKGLSNNQAKKWCRNNGVNWDKDAYYKMNNPSIFKQMKDKLTGNKPEQPVQQPKPDPKAPAPIPDVEEEPQKEAAQVKRQETKQQSKPAKQEDNPYAMNDWDDENDRKVA